MVGEVTERMAVVRTRVLPEDLVARVLSGLVLGGVAIAANWAGIAPFAVLVTLVAVLMGWEWCRVVRGIEFDSAELVQHAAVVAAAAAAFYGQTVLALAIVAAGAIVVAGISRGEHPLLSVLGVLYVGLPAIGLVWLRRDETSGSLAILFIYVVVWTTDTFAYTCGKLIGGPKLWPTLSPMKTWAGTLGGVGFAALASLVFAYVGAHPAPLALASVGVLLSVAAQTGDLAESALKRMFAVKHASFLIPGHGGFLDRMDGIVAAAAVAALVAALRDSQLPGNALLFW